MSDNATLPTGLIIATDDVGSTHYQRIKLDAGGDGATVPLVAGAQVAAASLPVVLASDDARIGILTETAPGTDTASSGLNGRLQRIAQRLTSLIALLPASLGAKTGAASLSVVPNTDTPWVINADGTDVVAANSSATGNFAVGLAAVAGKTNYLTGFSAGGTGATTALMQNLTITGLLGGTIYHFFAIPAIGTGVVQINVDFARPIPASATNTVISLTVPNFGAGALLVSGQIRGFYR